MPEVAPENSTFPSQKTVNTRGPAVKKNSILINLEWRGVSAQKLKYHLTTRI